MSAAMTFLSRWHGLAQMEAFQVLAGTNALADLGPSSRPIRSEPREITTDAKNSMSSRIGSSPSTNHPNPA